MGKASKVKYELRDSGEMVDLIQTLKDIADNKYFTLINQKDQLRRFGESFVEFFRLLSLTKVNHPLINNNNPVVGLLVITIEGSFLARFNNSIIRLAIEESKKHPQHKFIAVGDKAVDHLKPLTPDLKLFSDMEGTGQYETAVALKDYLIDEVMNNRLGRVMVFHSWPKNFETQKNRKTKLLPSGELLSRQVQFASEFDNIIEESDPVQAIVMLTNLWLTSKLYEILVDTTIASAAAQSAFLEESVDRMRKEQKRIKLKYRKARKGDIDKGLRETFVARMMSLQAH